MLTIRLENNHSVRIEIAPFIFLFRGGSNIFLHFRARSKLNPFKMWQWWRAPCSPFKQSLATEQQQQKSLSTVSPFGLLYFVFFFNVFVVCALALSSPMAMVACVWLLRSLRAACCAWIKIHRHTATIGALELARQHAAFFFCVVFFIRCLLHTSILLLHLAVYNSIYIFEGNFVFVPVFVLSTNPIFLSFLSSFDSVYEWIRMREVFRVCVRGREREREFDCANTEFVIHVIHLCGFWAVFVWATSPSCVGAK